MTSTEIKNDLLEHKQEITTLTAFEIAFCYGVDSTVAAAALQGLVKDGVLTATRNGRRYMYTVKS